MIEREIENQILEDFHRGKVITIIGPRQVGKTTLLNQIDTTGKKVLFLNCDDETDSLTIEGKSSSELRNLLEGYDIAFIDEVQRVKNIGLTLKKIADLKLKTNVIVTGSSSLSIRDEINEPATGRLIEYNLFPLSLSELASHSSELEVTKTLESRMIYGSYPEVVTDPSHARRTILGLTNNYLYKDILSYGGVRKPEILQKLVRALALQIGSEVSYNELSKIVGIDKNTVETYIGLLEKCFVVFRLDSFSRNMRNEIQKGKKIYFYDNGIRNAIISNFAPLELRNDVGALWENLMISERVKRNAYTQSYAQPYFWRTHSQKEIDYIEECDGKLSAFEFKWNERSKAKVPADFMEAYPGSTFEIITPSNFWTFVGR
ncbi:MAG: ATP-binding protein [Muribaculum sp.]|nr:ATP-binding protein [Muribaculum sp.]